MFIHRPQTMRALIGSAIAMSLTVLSACGPSAPPRPNILLITMDTTRADHIGAYGFALAQTQNIDQLAKEGVTFDDAVASAPITLPSHSSIMTGLYPPAHGVRDNGSYRLSDNAVTLAERLKAVGYETRAFVSAQVLNRRYNLNQGFDSYDDDLWGEDDPKLFMIRYRQAGETIAKVLNWYEQWMGQPKTERKPFFTWVHLFDPHQPYRPPGWALAMAPSPYDAEIAYADHELGRLFTQLRETGQLDNTLVIFTSDHGESLGEHNEKTHAIFVYSATTHVPLIMRYPTALPSGMHYQEPVRHVDLVPTILGLLGLPGGKETQGEDLLPAIKGKVDHPHLPQFSESLLSEVGFGMAPLYALTKDSFKWIRAPKPELYSLKNDPNELANLYPDPEKLYSKLDGALEKVFDDSKLRALDSGGSPMGKETIEMLQSMGYLQGADQRKSMGGIDPKDGIVVYNRMEEARHLAQHDKWKEAEVKLREILKDYPKNVTARSILALTLLRENRLDEAQNEYLKVLSDDGDKARCYVMLATIAMLRNHLDESEKFNLLALEASPEFVEAASNIGMLALLRGDEAKARQWYDKAVAIDPTFPPVYRRIGDVYFDRKQYTEALAYYEKTLQRLPRDFRALVQAGTSARYVAKVELAEKYYLQAQRARPESWIPQFNFACMLAVNQDTEGALTQLQSAVNKGLAAEVAQREPDLKSLRKNPRFAVLMKQAKERAVRSDD